MNRFFCIVLLLFSNKVFSFFSGPAFVTKENQDRFHVDIHSVFDSSTGTCKIRIPSTRFGSKSAWLVQNHPKADSKPVGLRGYIWGNKDTPEDIILISKLSDDSFNKVSSTGGFIGEPFYEIFINTRYSPYTYVYIDAPRQIHDGGYYYFIDVSSYCE